MTIWSGRGSEPQDEPLHLEVLNDRDAVRRRLAGKERLVQDLTDALYEVNPIKLETTDPQEFRAEAETITLSLPRHLTVDLVQNVVHQEFVNWFDSDMAGDRHRYGAAALAVAQVLRTHGVTVHEDLEESTDDSLGYNPRHAAPEGDDPSGVVDIRDLAS